MQGRQVWIYDTEFDDAEALEQVERTRKAYASQRWEKKHSEDALLRIQSRDRRPQFQEKDGEPELDRALRRGLWFYGGLQQDDGHWPGDYGGPMFLMPGLLVALHTMEQLDKVVSPAHREEMERYLRNHQNKDGGYGLHIEGGSTMFGTVLNYVSLRLLGVDADDPVTKQAREWILSRGGATHVPSWGKFWLAVLGVYDWLGMNPMPPEMWLLPYALPMHPGRFWCHCRMVYLPMSYVYGKRGTAKPCDLTDQIKQELYTENYDEIDWNAARNLCAKEDLYYPHPLVQDVLWWTLYQFEPLLDGSKLRSKALAHVMEHIHYEDDNTRYVDIGPVNKVINMLCCWFEDPDSVAVKKHIPRLFDYLWVAEDGMKMQGYNGSQLWDTSFAVQAIGETGFQEEFAYMMKAANSYIDVAQVREDCAPPLDKYYRHISKGAWPFSTRDHGWPITDCTSEGLKAALVLANMSPELVGPHISAERLYDCVNVILSFQNKDNGWATYENTRSYAALEIINPAETFGDIMIDYSYVECSSACITALSAFRKRYPNHRAAEINSAIERGLSFLEGQQRKDGSWYGSWGVCFTYAGWFGVEGLVAGGKTFENSVHIRKASEFLLSKQLPDGGWGESYLSCQDKEYTHLEGGRSHVVNTSWALLTLLAAGQAKVDPEPLHRAAKNLIKMQESDGDWPQQEISGVFNRNCMITYANYRNIFPLWALGRYRKECGGGCI